MTIKVGSIVTVKHLDGLLMATPVLEWYRNRGVIGAEPIPAKTVAGTVVSINGDNATIQVANNFYGVATAALVLQGDDNVPSFDEQVAAFVASPKVLRRTDADPAETKTLQQLLNRMGFPVGTVDGVFGGGTESGVRSFQWYRIDQEGQDNGVVDSTTKQELGVAYATSYQCGAAYRHTKFDVEVFGGSHPKLGRIPDKTGKMSTFGGPDDAGDRGYGQACIPVNPPTVSQLYAQYPDLVEMGLFRKGLSDPLPMTTCCGQTMQAGISWCLNPESYYIAMRWASGGSPSPYAPWNRRVLIIHKDWAVVAAPSDYGPATWTGRDSDLSPGCADGLYLEPDDGQRLPTDGIVKVLWAADGTPIGPVRLREAA